MKPSTNHPAPALALLLALVTAPLGLHRPPASAAAGPGGEAGEELSSESAFAALHALIKRQPGESRWMEIDWYPSVWEGRVAAAAEGKPLLLMAGSGGAPAAGC